MNGIIAPQLITSTCLFLDGVGQLGEASEEVGREPRVHC